MLVLEWQGKSIDDGAQNFQQLGNAVEALGFISELEEDIIDRPSNIRPEIQEFAIDAVKGGFQEVTLTRILRVK